VLKECTETTPYVVSKILSHTSVFKLDVSSATFPRVFKNNQFGRILLSQAFTTTRRSEVGRFVEESCSRWNQALLAREGVSSQENLYPVALEALQACYCGSQITWSTSRVFWSFMVAWNAQFGLSQSFTDECKAWLASHGLVLKSMPYAVTEDGLLSLLNALGGRDSLIHCKTLVVSNCPHFSSTCLGTLASFSSSVTTLDLSRNRNRVTNFVLEQFAIANSCLRSLILRDCDEDISDGLAAILDRCGPIIERLDLGIDAGAQKDFLFPSLPPQTLETQASLQSRSLQKVTEVSGKLISLSLRGRPSLATMEVLSDIVKANTNLRSLDLRQCTNVDIKDLSRLLKCAPTLEKLKCAGPIEEKALQALAYQPYTTSLRTLYFEDMDKNLTPKYVTSLIKGTAVLCRTLSALHSADVSLADIVATNLENLTMYCSSLENHQFTTVIKFVSRWRPTMKKLRLTVKKAGDVDIAALVKGCTQLESFHKRSLSCDPAESALMDLPLRSLTLENAHQLQIGMNLLKRSFFMLPVPDASPLFLRQPDSGFPGQHSSITTVQFQQRSFNPTSVCFTCFSCPATHARY
jgi:hypothetical protein